MRKKVCKILREAGLDPFAVENPILPGTPDVNYRDGWIELKDVDRWPPRGGPMRVPHFTPQQRIRHRKRRAVGGRSYVLIRVDRDWLLFDGAIAAEILGDVEKEMLIHHSICYWKGVLDADQLIEYVRESNS